jgi:molybdopterin biosynthesis enzyme
LDPRPEYHRAFVKWTTDINTFTYPSAFSTGNQHSSRLLSMNEANCLVMLPGKTKEKATVNKGEILKALIIEKI